MERLVPIKSEEFTAMFERVQRAIAITSRLNALSPEDTAAVNIKLKQLLGRPGGVVTKDVPESTLVAGQAAQ